MPAGSGLTFDGWIEREVTRLNDEAETYEREAASWRRASLFYRILALVILVVVDPDWSRWITLPAMFIAGVALWRERRARQQHDRVFAMASIRTGNIKGLVDAATHPSRRDTLLVRAPFDVRRTEAPN